MIIGRRSADMVTEVLKRVVIDTGLSLKPMLDLRGAAKGAETFLKISDQNVGNPLMCVCRRHHKSRCETWL